MSTKRLEAPAEWREDIDEWLAALKAAGYTAETLRTRRCKMVHVARLLGVAPGDVTGDLLVSVCGAQAWKQETRKGYGNTLRSFFRFYARRHGTPDPSTDLPRVRKARPCPHPCPDVAILDALRRATPQEALMIRLAAECGLRRGEIARVRSDDVMPDLLGRSLIVHGKGGKQRVVPLPDDLADAVAGAHGFLFPGRWSGHVEESYVSRHVSALLPDGFGCHSLRHRFATAEYRATHDIYLVSRLLGHESVETTQRYTAMADDRLRSGLDAVTLRA